MLLTSTDGEEDDAAAAAPLEEDDGGEEYLGRSGLAQFWTSCSRLWLPPEPWGEKGWRGT